MAFIAITIFLILSATALLHAAWGFGLVWPGIDQQSLVNTVIGDPNISQIPPLPITLAVAFAIAAAGICALWGARLIEMPLPQWMQKTGVIVLTFIFLIRGLAAYIPNGPLSNSTEPFATLNILYFSPLILAIGAGYAFIWYATKDK